MAPGVLNTKTHNIKKYSNELNELKKFKKDLQNIRKFVENNFEYVEKNFAKKVRKFTMIKKVRKIFMDQQQKAKEKN